MQNKGIIMADNKQIFLAKEDKIAIGFMIVMFLLLFAGMLNENNKRHKQHAAQEQLENIQKQIHTKTFDLSKQK